MTEQPIWFNSKNKDYSFLSNSFISEIVIDGLTYFHVEGYYQSTRLVTHDQKGAEHIRNLYSPIICRKRADEYHIPPEKIEEWNSGVKIRTMKRAVLVKFVSNRNLCSMLLSTGDTQLILKAPSDDYWGSGKDGKGENILGKILMEVRESLSRCRDTETFQF